MGSPKETGQGDREIQGDVTGQGRPRSPTLVGSAEGGHREHLCFQYTPHHCTAALPPGVRLMGSAPFGRAHTRALNE